MSQDALLAENVDIVPLVGNGAARGSRTPLDATCDLSVDALVRHLEAPDHVPTPPLGAIVHWQLGAIDGTRLTFTDACA